MLKKIMVGTPSYDGTVTAHYVASLVAATKEAAKKNIDLVPVFLSYDALVQRARNELVKLAVEFNVESLIFIDHDLEFNPHWVVELAESPLDVIGGTYPKKTDEKEIYPISASNLELNGDGLIEVQGIGTGFLKLSRKALLTLWEKSSIYWNEGAQNRMVFDIGIIDGNLYGEDRMMCKKLTDLGFKIWLNPSMCCKHIGVKIYERNFLDYLSRLKK
jgi:hypothetical protein